jgi:hypothetical protein
VDNTIHYLNTDLDIWSPADLANLAAGFAANGVCALHVTKLPDESWYATFEVEDCDESNHEPEETIAALLTAIEALPPTEHGVLMGCTRREFNIGFDCGEKPWEFNQALSNGLLERLAKAGGSIRITIYPDRRERE